ncbi:hypothetical protein [Microcoleus sp.]|uniref:hypothetical protein n=1 Tax=Microcoleus sp. TaxID=44472 RepID=UPI00403EE5A3
MNYSKGFANVESKTANVESKTANVEISLGAFISTSESLALTQSSKFKKAKIIDQGQCVGFALDDLNIEGIAFPSVNKKGVICVGIISYSSVANLPKIETDRQKQLFSSMEPEVRRLVAEAYKTKFLRQNQNPSF